jgi:hypothetical protein
MIDRRRFLLTTGTTIGAAMFVGCSPSSKTQQEDNREIPAMKHELAGQLRELYGVEFPNDLFAFWEWYNKLQPEVADSFHEELGIRLVGPFDVLAGRFDNVELRYPAVLHWRYQFDPPEFFTVFSGNTDGLHWGYWFDDPQRLPPAISAFYASDAFELWTAGSTLFEAIANWVDGVKDSLKENIEYDSENEEDYRNSLAAVSKLEKLLPTTSSTTSRKPTHQTPEGMGVVIPPNAGTAGDLLLRGKQLWFDGNPQRFETLAQAYDELDRKLLASVARTHKMHPRLPRLDILEYRIGDYHSMDEALAEPEKVIRLEVGNAKLDTLPDLSTLSELEELSLWGNALSELPSSLAKCSKLKLINLHRNALSTIPEVIFELPNLESLKLGQNKITSLSEVLERLQNLKKLDLFGNPIPESDRDLIREALPDTEVSF